MNSLKTMGAPQGRLVSTNSKLHREAANSIVLWKQALIPGYRKWMQPQHLSPAQRQKVRSIKFVTSLRPIYVAKILMADFSHTPSGPVIYYLRRGFLYILQVNPG